MKRRASVKKLMTWREEMSLKAEAARLRGRLPSDQPRAVIATLRPQATRQQASRCGWSGRPRRARPGLGGRLRVVVFWLDKRRQANCWRPEQRQLEFPGAIPAERHQPDSASLAMFQTKVSLKHRPYVGAQRGLSASFLRHVNPTELPIYGGTPS